MSVHRRCYTLSALRSYLHTGGIGIRHYNVIEEVILSSDRPDRSISDEIQKQNYKTPASYAHFYHFLWQTFWTMLLALKYLLTGLNMRWKLNYFNGNSLNQASVLLRTHCSRLFTRVRDNDVTFCREYTQYSVTFSNLFTPIHRASRNNNSLDRHSSSLCNRYRAFSMVSKTRC